MPARSATKKRRAPAKKLEHRIDVDVANGVEIKLGFQGEKFAMAARRGSRVIWSCAKHFPFAIQFAPGCHLTALRKGAAWELDVPAMPPLLSSYKYTVAAYYHGRVLICDPEVIIIPPRK